MSSTNLVRLGGLVAMVGSIVFVLGLLPGPWWNWRLAEVVILPLQYLLFFVGVSVAIVAIATLLRETRHDGSGILACGVSLVGVVLVFVGLFLGFVGSLVIYAGVLVATGGLMVLASLTTRTNTLAWWGGVALVAGGISFFSLTLSPLPASLMGVLWLVVGYAIFRAGGRRIERPARVR